MMLMLRSYSIYFNRQMNIIWKVAMALIAISLILWIGFVMPAKSEAEHLKGEFKVIQASGLQQSQTPDKVEDQSPASQLASFESHFPTESSLPDSLEKMIKLAQAKGLEPREASYHVVNNNPGGLLSYQISMPMDGTYPKMASFISELLVKLPNLSLDNVSLHRKTAEDDWLDLTLVMTLYTRRENGHP